MIKVEFRVFEHGDAGLQVRVVARGVAQSKREQIYYEALRKGSEQSLLDAGAECARLGLAPPLSEAFKAAAAGAVPAPLSENAVEIKLPTGPTPLTPFREFIKAVVDDYRSTAALREVGSDQGKREAELIGEMVKVLLSHAQDFESKQRLLAEMLRAQQAGNTGNN